MLDSLLIPVAFAIENLYIYNRTFPRFSSLPPPLPPFFRLYTSIPRNIVAGPKQTQRFNPIFRSAAAYTAPIVLDYVHQLGIQSLGRSWEAILMARHTTHTQSIVYMCVMNWMYSAGENIGNPLGYGPHPECQSCRWTLELEESSSTSARVNGAHSHGD
jgi:hypothetical protein